MSDDPFDFSPLDPQGNAARYERMVQRVLERVGLPQLAPPPLLLDLVRWGRVAVLLTAVLALAAWLPSLHRAHTGRFETMGEDPIELVSAWAQAGHVPADVDPVQALGRPHGH
jgi:hypothetical protein